MLPSFAGQPVISLQQRLPSAEPAPPGNPHRRWDHRANGLSGGDHHRWAEGLRQADLSLAAGARGARLAPAASPPSRVRPACVDLSAERLAEGAAVPGPCSPTPVQANAAPASEADRQPARARRSGRQTQREARAGADLAHRRDRRADSRSTPAGGARSTGGGPWARRGARRRQRHPHHRSGPSSRSPGADLVASGCRIGGMAKGSGMITRTWPPCWPIAVRCGVPAPSGRPWGGRSARSFNGDHGGRRHPSNQRLLLAFCSRPPLNPEALSRLEAGLRRLSQHLARPSPRDG